MNVEKKQNVDVIVDNKQSPILPNYLRVVYQRALAQGLDPLEHLADWLKFFSPKASKDDTKREE